MHSNMLISDTIRLFLDSIGRSEEYEYYLKKFRSDRSSCFAILCPDEVACESGGESLRLALQFLQRLDLVPAVLFTGPRADHMRRALGGENNLLTVYRPHHRAPRQGFGEQPADVPGGNLELPIELGAAVQQARAKNKCLAIVWEKETVQPAVNFLSRQLSSRVYLIRMAGALRDRDGRELLYYDYRKHSSREQLWPSDGALVELATAIGEAGRRLHLSVTAPYNLLKEIFTVKGAGTMVRAGSQIRHYTNAAELDRDRLLHLLGQSFQKELVNQSFLDQAAHIYLEEDYQGAIILEARPMGDYLSKFAVDKQARGLGIAQELWEQVSAAHPRLFWRSRHHNSINRWYASLADGMHRAPPHWNIFWRGVATADLPGIIDFCVNRPEDFAPAASS